MAPVKSRDALPCIRFLDLPVLAARLVVSFVGCATMERDPVRPVWTQPHGPTSATKAPRGPQVSPAKAYAIARNSRALSRKHIWHIYADSRYYYIHDTFFGTSESAARAMGSRIDGRRGAVLPR